MMQLRGRAETADNCPDLKMWETDRAEEPTAKPLCSLLVYTKCNYSKQLCETHFRWCCKPLQWQEIICVETSERQVLSLKLIYRPLVWRLLCQAGIVVRGNIIIVFPPSWTGGTELRQILTVENQGRGGHLSDQLSFPRYEGLQQHDGILVVTPGVHLPVGVPALLCEFVPGLGFAQQLTDRALGQPQHVLGEQSLADIVDRQQLPHPPWVAQRVQGLPGGLLHVVPQHLLQPRLHWVGLGDPGGGEEGRQGGRQGGRGVEGGEGSQTVVGETHWRLLRLDGRGGVPGPGAQSPSLASSLGGPRAAVDHRAGSGGRRSVRRLRPLLGGGARGELGLAGLLLDVGGEAVAPPGRQVLQVGRQRAGEQAGPQGEPRLGVEGLGSLQEQHLQAGGGARGGGLGQARQEHVGNLRRFWFGADWVHRADGVPEIKK